MDRLGMTAVTDDASTPCPPDCLMKSNKKLFSCAAIFVVLQYIYMHVGKVVCDLHATHVSTICPVRDIPHVRKCTRPSPA